MSSNVCIESKDSTTKTLVFLTGKLDTDKITDFEGHDDFVKMCRPEEQPEFERPDIGPV